MNREYKKRKKEAQEKQLKRWRLTIQNELNNYSTLQKDIDEIRSEIEGIGASVIDDMPHSTDVTSKTENQAIKIMQKIEQFETTKKAIDRAVAKLPGYMRKYFEYRYIKEYTNTKCCRLLYMSQRTYEYKNWDILKAVAIEFTYFNLFNVQVDE